MCANTKHDTHVNIVTLGPGGLGPGTLGPGALGPGTLGPGA